MNNILKEAISVVSKLPESEQNAIAQMIWQELAQREQLRHQTPIDFMQFAGIASPEEVVLLETLEQEIDEQRSLDLQRQIDL